MVVELPAPGASERSSTAVIITNGRGEYLLHLRDANKPICDSGAWSLVGGGAEGTETPDEAIRREIREETGLVLPGITAFTAVHDEGPYVTEGHIHVYTARWDGDAHALPVSEGIMFHWFRLATMEHLTMAPWAHRAIKAHHFAQAG
ncbi:NUDIX domain-containing protein [Streptomyces sp. NPDC060184]|uniref:NUDIX domain-containing protein n=1 Tax=Streptomyces sp. NPDC060184 TaxID=3347064 RepID=UPI00365478F5